MHQVGESGQIRIADVVFFAHVYLPLDEKFLCCRVSFAVVCDSFSDELFSGYAVVDILVFGV